MNVQTMRERVDDEKVFLVSAIEAEDQQQLDPEIMRLNGYRWTGTGHQKIYEAIKQQRLSGKPAELAEIGVLVSGDKAAFNFLCNPDVIPQPSRLREISRKLAECETTAEPKQEHEKPFSFVHGVELVSNIQNPDYIVDDRIENDTVGAWFGPSECFKSFLAIASLLCTATGTEFYGLSVRQVPSFYICGEGKSAVARRVRAWEIFNGRQLAKDDPFFCIDRFNMLSGEPKTRNQLVAEIHSILRYFKLEGPLYIVYDTLSSLFNIEESSNSEMAAALRTINHIRKETGGGTSHVIHHTGHGNQDRHRGAYSFKANVDAYHHIYREDKPSMMTCWKGGGKMKDAEPLKDMWFKAQVVEIGLEYKGRQVTSLALDHIPDYDPALAADQTASREQVKLFNLLLDCQEGTNGINIDKLADLAVKAGLYTRKQTAHRGIMRLVSKDLFKYANDRIYTK